MNELLEALKKWNKALEELDESLAKLQMEPPELPQYNNPLKCEWCTNKVYKNGRCYPHELAASHRNITVREAKSRPINIEVNHD